MVRFSCEYRELTTVGVWRFLLKKVKIKMENEDIQTDFLKGKWQRVCS